MKRLRKILRIGLVIVVLLLAVLAGGSTWMVRRSLPQLSGSLSLSGLSAPVKVLRDQWGVAQIYAQNEHDLFMAQGYVHAQDRLWQMEMERREGEGLLSEILGSQTLAYDRAIRTYGLDRGAVQEWNNMDPQSKASLQAYADGVNGFIDTHKNSLPIEFTLLNDTPRPWTPIDSLAWANLVSYSLAGNHRIEYLRALLIAKVGITATNQLLPAYGSDKPLIVPPGIQSYAALGDAGLNNMDAVDNVVGDPGAVWGSNSWVVSGSHTTTGKPLLANDTHLGLTFPSDWYENGLHGGGIDAEGFSFPGEPAIIIGHNQYISWGATNLNPDVQDLYIEKLDNPTHPTKYLYNGVWKPITVINESIPLKGHAPVPFSIYLTDHGPIANYDLIDDLVQPGADPVSLHWTSLGNSGILQSVIAIDKAQNWEQFHQAASMWNLPGQNLMYADIYGNIGYQMTGQIPIRAPGHTGAVPVPGWTSQYEWKGYIPYEQLPHGLNPPQGFLASANNKVVPDNYPYIIANEWDAGYRAERINDLLKATPKLSIADMERIQSDTYSIPAEEMRPYLLNITPTTSEQKQAMATVANWDLTMETNQVGASIFNVWYWYLMRNTLNNKLGTSLALDYLSGQYERHGTFQVPAMLGFLKDPNSPWFDDKTTPQVETRDDIILKSFNDALTWLDQNYGTDQSKWVWGNLHQLTFTEQPLAASNNWLVKKVFTNAPFPARGDNFTVDASSYAFNSPYAVDHGSSQRDIIDLGNLDNSLMINSTGQSGQLFDPHRDDQEPLWENMQYIPMYNSQQAINAHTTDTLMLTP